MQYILIKFKEPNDATDQRPRTAIVVGAPDPPTAMYHFRLKHPNAEQIDMVICGVNEVIIVR